MLDHHRVGAARRHRRERTPRRITPPCGWRDAHTAPRSAELYSPAREPLSPKVTFRVRPALTGLPHRLVPCSDVWLPRALLTRRRRVPAGTPDVRWLGNSPATKRPPRIATIPPRRSENSLTGPKAGVALRLEKCSRIATIINSRGQEKTPLAGGGPRSTRCPASMPGGRGRACWRGCNRSLAKEDNY
jgi:hypothetical protein